MGLSQLDPKEETLWYFFQNNLYLGGLEADPNRDLLYYVTDDNKLCVYNYPQEELIKEVDIFIALGSLYNLASVKINPTGELLLIYDQDHGYEVYETDNFKLVYSNYDSNLYLDYWGVEARGLDWLDEYVLPIGYWDSGRVAPQSKGYIEFVDIRNGMPIASFDPELSTYPRYDSTTDLTTEYDYDITGIQVSPDLSYTLIREGWSRAWILDNTNFSVIEFINTGHDDRSMITGFITNDRYCYVEDTGEGWIKNLADHQLINNFDYFADNNFGETNPLDIIQTIVPNPSGDKLLVSEKKERDDTRYYITLWDNEMKESEEQYYFLDPADETSLDFPDLTWIGDQAFLAGTNDRHLIIHSLSEKGTTLKDEGNYDTKIIASNFDPDTTLPDCSFINPDYEFQIGRNVPSTAVGLMYFENPTVNRRYNLSVFNNLVNNNKYLNSYSNTEQRCFSDEERNLNLTQLNILSPNHAIFYYDKPIITDITRDNGRYRYYYKHECKYPIDDAKVFTLGEEFAEESTLGFDRCYLEYDIRYLDGGDNEMVMAADAFDILDTYGNKVNDELTYLFYLEIHQNNEGFYYLYVNMYLSEELTEDYYIKYNPYTLETGEEYKELISAEPIFDEVSEAELNANINNQHYRGYLRENVNNGYNIKVPITADTTQKPYHNYQHKTDQFINYDCEVTITVT